MHNVRERFCSKHWSEKSHTVQGFSIRSRRLKIIKTIYLNFFVERIPMRDHSSAAFVGKRFGRAAIEPIMWPRMSAKTSIRYKFSLTHIRIEPTYKLRRIPYSTLVHSVRFATKHSNRLAFYADIIIYMPNGLFRVNFAAKSLDDAITWRCTWKFMGNVTKRSLDEIDQIVFNVDQIEKLLFWTKCIELYGKETIIFIYCRIYLLYLRTQIYRKI